VIVDNLVEAIVLDRGCKVWERDSATLPGDPQ